MFLQLGILQGSNTYLKTNVPCLNLSKEFRFLYQFGTVFHITLTLKHSASVSYREVFVLGNLSRLFFGRL